MTQILMPKEPQLQLADILRNHISDYQKAYPLWPEHKKIVSDILNCRTAKLGGKIISNSQEMKKMQGIFALLGRTTAFI